MSTNTTPVHYVVTCVFSSIVNRCLLKLACLNEFDENNVCHNVLKRLDSIMDLKDSKFILHDWLYKKKEIKSNLEMTTS
ncbi:unnamed protein product [Brachionus calyciflorus]|uniref:Uncharacterized protein n=1 Tax=Brachionus calyciflorus TaxID=104777 RepID=A0A813PTG5_9BILA|nr:unnamed protein product [Brachionus calyciflorus]